MIPECREIVEDGRAGGDWEAIFAPYDEATYADALVLLRADDIVLDIGSGDGRFARRAAERVRHVVAVERDAALLARSLPHPRLMLVHADARRWPFPPGLTVGVLLMRHCRHVGLYQQKLRAAGATRLITNARFGLAVEAVDLTAPRRPFGELAGGWWGCDCGAAGFKPFADPAELTPETDGVVHDVVECESCGRGEWRLESGV